MLLYSNYVLIFLNCVVFIYFHFFVPFDFPTMVYLRVTGLKHFRLCNSL